MKYETPLTEEMINEIVLKWGTDVQTDVLVEECAELIKGVMKLKRMEKNSKKIIKEDKNDILGKLSEEVADVIMMIDQIVSMYGIKEHVEDWISSKYVRLVARLLSTNRGLGEISEGRKEEEEGEL